MDCQMRKKFNLGIVAFNVVAFFILLVGVPIAGVHEAPTIATYLAILGSFGAFIMLLDVRQDRVLKGFILIGTGLVYQLLYPKYFYIFVDGKTMSPDIVSHFEIYGQAILLACSGAGGSLIAVHADKTSADFEPPLLANRQNDLLESALSNSTLSTKKLAGEIKILIKKANIIIVILVLILIMSAIKIFR
jgi:hypothetical protein